MKVFRPDAIVLDMQLPVMDGWSVLKRLKTSEYADIPVHVMSGMDKRKLGMELGAKDYLLKPIDPQVLEDTLATMYEKLSDKEIKKVLLIEDNEELNSIMTELLSSKGLEVSCSIEGSKGLQSIEDYTPDLVILDLGLPDVHGFELFREIKEKQSDLPVIIFTGEELNKEELQFVNQVQNTTVILKSKKSFDRLLEETELFVHSLRNNGIGEQQELKIRNFDDTNVLAGKKMLIVDDDMRNIYALETILDNEGVAVTIAGNGQEALDEIANGTTKYDAVLMDIMMPVMDGYEATRKIRGNGT